MYEAFYRFREKPFHVTADPAFFYPSRHHQEALYHLTYGIKQRLGFLLITGEVGTGKTTLAKALVDKLEYPAKTALILNPTLSGGQLLRAIVQDFGVLPNGSNENAKPRRSTLTRGELLYGMERFLLAEVQSGGTAVLIIDEAQALSASALEQVRLLSNVETTKTKLLQIVLVGQPELDERLVTESRLRALNQRIVVRYQIQPLGTEEVAAYIEHRIRVAGEKALARFTPGAMVLIARVSGGIPRRINLLCDQALLAGFVQESRTINESMVAQVHSTIAPEKNLKEEDLSISQRSSS